LLAWVCALRRAALPAGPAAGTGSQPTPLVSFVCLVDAGQDGRM